MSSYNKLFPIILVLLVLATCNRDPFSSDGTASEIEVVVQVPTLGATLQKLQAESNIDRVFITVTAHGMDTVQQDLTVADGHAQGEITVEKGNNRTFTLTGEDDSEILFEAVKTQHIKQDKEVVTLSIPMADFAATPDSGLAPLTVQFQENSSSQGGPVTSWLWNFGDGTTSSEQNPAHQYEQYGIFTVTLQVQDSTGSRYTKVREDYVQAAQLPTAKLTAFPVTGEAPLTVSLRDHSLPGTKDLESWLWDFGDETPFGTTQSPEHTYQNPGLYTVALQVETAVGIDTKIITDYILVKEEGSEPTARFSVDNTDVIIGQEVNFTDESQSGDGVITDWLWQFGDGTVSTEQHPSHQYWFHGNYLASLTVETDLGGVSTMLSTSDTIHVEKPNLTEGDTVFAALQYGDGTPEDWTVGERLDQMFLVHFTATGYTADSVQIDYPVDLELIQMFLAGDQEFTIVILDKGTLSLLGQTTVTANDPEGAWHTFNVSDMNLTLWNDFYVGLRYTGERNIDDFWWPAVGFDTTPPSLERSYIYNPGTSGPQLIDYSKYGPGNLMFRAIIKAINQEIAST